MTKLLNRTSTRTIGNAGSFFFFQNAIFRKKNNHSLIVMFKVNYIHWHFVSDMLVYTTELMRDAFFELMKNEYDVKKRPPR